MAHVENVDPNPWVTGEAPAAYVLLRTLQSETPSAGLFALGVIWLLGWAQEWLYMRLAGSPRTCKSSASKGSSSSVLHMSEMSPLESHTFAPVFISRKPLFGTSISHLCGSCFVLSKTWLSFSPEK